MMKSTYIGSRGEGGGSGNIAVGSLPAEQPIILTLADTSDSVQLTAGEIYRVWASVDCFIRAGGSSVVATTSDTPLTAEYPEPFECLKGQEYVAGIVSTGTGKLYFTRME